MQNEQIKMWKDFLCELKKHKNTFRSHKEEIQEAIKWIIKIEKSKNIVFPENSFLMLPLSWIILQKNCVGVKARFYLGENVENRLREISHRSRTPYFISRAQTGNIMANPMELMTLLKFGFFRTHFRDLLNREEPFSSFIGVPGVGFQNPFISREIIESPQIQVVTRVFPIDNTAQGRRKVLIFNTTEAVF